MGKQSAFFLWLFLLAQSVSAQVVLQDTSKFVSVGQSISVLEDKTAQLSFEQVRRRTDFVPAPTDKFQFGYTSSAYWFRFVITNRGRENVKHWLIGLLDAGSIDYADFYLVYPNGRVTHQPGGLKRPYVDQGFIATTPFFRATLPTNERVTVFFRLESSLTIFGKVTVWDEYYNLSKGRLIIFVIWMFLGLFILRSLNSFVLARFIPDPQFRFYALCTFLLYISTLARTGVYSIIFSNYPNLLEWMNYGMGRLLPLGLAGWMYTLLDRRPAFRPLRGLLLLIAAISFGGLFLPLFVQNAAIGQFFAVLILLTYSLFFICVVLVWIVGQRPSLYFVVPIAICTIPFSLYQLQSLKLIPYNPAFSQLALLALAIEMVSMSLVLGRIVQSYIKERINTANALIREKVEVDKLQELNSLKTQFFTNISHEFRTPLTLILGPVEQAVADYAQDARFPLIQRNANRLLSLINQLLDLSKLEADQLRPEPEPGDLAAFFRTLASSFSSLAESRRITFIFTQSESERWATFDRDKVEKIATNLLANAFKFTPDGNQVCMKVDYVSASVPFPLRGGLPDTLRLTIEDTGIGIASQNLPHIFERFYQGAVHTGSADARSAGAGSVHTGSVHAVEGINSRPYEGTGIGLALVSELVRVLSGQVDVISTEGIGTTFTVTLPLAAMETRKNTTVSVPDHGLPLDGPSLTVASTVPGKPVRSVNTDTDPFAVTEADQLAPPEKILLIIDDNADIRAYVRSIFATDYRILEAEDGQDGLQKATAGLPDVVICDLMMPRLDGFGFCRALKSQEATSHIPVVMLTAKATVEDRIEGFGLGADDYLTKPFNRGELRARVGNLVQQRQRLYRQFVTHTAASQEQPAPLMATGKPVAPALLATEQKFLDRLSSVVLKHIDQADFSVEALADAVDMSRTQLHRKLKALTNASSTHFIRDVRLTKAAQLLGEGGEAVTQVAYAVGFDNLSYFAKVFQERYGVLPSQFGKVSTTVED